MPVPSVLEGFDYIELEPQWAEIARAREALGIGEPCTSR